MGRGPVVQARKNVVNAAKGKVFSIHAKLIAIAAQKGGDPDKNPTLYSAVHKAKKEGVPNDNIERAIKKGTGEDKTAAQIVEITYEGYAPGGVAVMVSALTDNKNRTVSSIRHIFSKYGGNMGESGAVSWMFHRKGVIFIDPSTHQFEELEELIYETNAEDLIQEETYIKVLTTVDDFNEIENFLEDKNIEIMESKIDFVPDNEIELDDFDKVLKFKKMIEAFDEDEDVSQVSTNEEISEKLSQEVDEFIEKNTFRT
ncbi:MAG: YebC/PmpR family DNA-binding transcriptional regulator [Candidatus Gracilibacteria bacterium]|nr:YebC/PmpR family DNA-binding transcriptional regulator [Candidatus Gracilibacteria bacterium]